jgi:hypothetical protein
VAVSRNRVSHALRDDCRFLVDERVGAVNRFVGVGFYSSSRFISQIFTTPKQSKATG